MQLNQEELTRLIRSTRKEDIIGDPKHGKFYIKQKGSGLGSVFVDMETGESTEEIHELIDNDHIQECDHFYKQIDDHNVQCTKCPLGHQFIAGLQRLENGKIITIK